ncbi:MAG: 2-phospho-L-lactate guanylyltransferase [Acidobacteria bacterium]|nr:MAG: 2-phospho-L-lactate guanylyltransferase [Acidobacteriota bacterium]PYY09513.1 MAG: 2-phospho-L-lactate guanylyltransferase [Acidobacteriota bacterium]
MILVPVKNLQKAKQRLSPVLDQASRWALAKAMLHDVLETLGTWAERPDEVALVTHDPFAMELASRFDFRIIAETADRSETDAIEMATAICQSQGVENTLVIPGDIPLLETWELERILRAAPEHGSVLVPSADRRGTNAAWRKPAGLFPLRFGNDSFQPHCNAARATGHPCVVLSLPGVALDVDNPADLKQLAAAPGGTRAQRLARQWDLTDYVLAANE